MLIDRAALDDRIDEVLDDLGYETDHTILAELNKELEVLQLFDALLYLEDEGFIETDDQGHIWPLGEPEYLKVEDGPTG